MSDEEGRWADGLIPDAPEWVRDLIEEEIDLRNARIVELERALRESEQESNRRIVEIERLRGQSK